MVTKKSAKINVMLRCGVEPHKVCASGVPAHDQSQQDLPAATDGILDGAEGRPHAQCRHPNLLMSVVAMQFHKDDATFCRDPADHVSLKTQAHRVNTMCMYDSLSDVLNSVVTAVSVICSVSVNHSYITNQACINHKHMPVCSYALIIVEILFI